MAKNFMKHPIFAHHILLSAILLIVLLPTPAWAYIGPGAGFALAGSFLAIFGALLSALSMVLFWPIRRVVRMIFRRRPPGKIRFRRVVILGLDGFDHHLAEKFIEEGKLPNLAALRDQGDFKPLRTTLPPISPVAWATFQTGVNPGKHNIFDFLTPDERTYQAKLSSVTIRTVRRRIGWGPISIPFGTKPDVQLLRKSKPFWNILSRYGVFNCIIRVPITFPPERLRGVQLSAMCVPDLRGTQGTFSHYTTRILNDSKKTGGEVHHVQRKGNTVQCELIGPRHPSHPEYAPIKLPFTVTIMGSDQVKLKINGTTHILQQGLHSDWIQVRFRVGLSTTISGVCRFLLLKTDPEFELYVTPVNIDPEKPAMAIGYPAVYPVYLAKRQGPYATLGLAEDTWALSEEVLSDEHFARQCIDIEGERESMFFDGLEKVPQGLCVCVFDGTDRMQHMFWRYLDEEHPARPADVPDTYRQVIEELYQRMDHLVGRTMAKCNDDDTLLMIVSDHGFTSFRRGVDLNRWLEENGYLVVDDARRNEEHLAGIDWSRTRAFAIGLSGIFLNISDKFEQGIVDPGKEAQRLRDEIQQKLTDLVDPGHDTRAIKRVYQATKTYRGPYKNSAPDLIVGYESGYRVAWETAMGRTSKDIFHDNRKAWSGDHCVDPTVVPGVLFCNRKIETGQVRLFDIAPTVLDIFGIPAPDYMDGSAFEIGESNDSGDTGVCENEESVGIESQVI
ncbi:MAG: alkaline phosphatase family protein [Pirellulales bacterium]|nr:alkaline phosphatase family protein [Pirellulales bacterium]